MFWYPIGASSVWDSMWYIIIIKVKVGDLSRGWPEGFLFNSYYRGVDEDADSFPRLLQLNLDPYLIMLSVKQGGINDHFLTQCGIERRSPWPLANTLLIRAIVTIILKFYHLEYLTIQLGFIVILTTFRPMYLFFGLLQMFLVEPIKNLKPKPLFNLRR